MPEVIPFLLYVIVPIPLTLTAIQILFIDLGFEMFASLSYAWEPSECPELLMQLQPRQPVTEESIEKKRRLALQKQKNGMLPPPPPDVDSEEYFDEFKVPGRFRRYYYEIQCMFYSQYWIDLFYNYNGEVLVDAEVLIWSFVEAGLIECSGALITFFSVLYFKWNVDPGTAVSAQGAGGYFMPHSPDLTLADGSILVFKI